MPNDDGYAEAMDVLRHNSGMSLSVLAKALDDAERECRTADDISKRAQRQLDEAEAQHRKSNAVARAARDLICEIATARKAAIR